MDKKYLKRDNSFYRDRYHQVIIIMMGVIVFVMAVIGLVAYQAINRPLPVFYAVQPDGKQKQIRANTEPNLLPDTLLRFASKAATVAYTFDFVNYNEQIDNVRPFFTDTGWKDYIASVKKLIETIVAGQIFVYGVVAGTPVISNQGPLPGKGYTWRIQIPFLVTYRTSETVRNREFMVRVMLVRVPTSKNPQGVGIDQFIMGGR